MSEHMVSDRIGSVGFCASCETIIDVSEWHPAGIGQISDGETRIYDFCSDRCRRRWDVGSASDGSTSSPTVEP